MVFVCELWSRLERGIAIRWSFPGKGTEKKESGHLTLSIIITHHPKCKCNHREREGEMDCYYYYYYYVQCGGQGPCPLRLAQMGSRTLWYLAFDHFDKNNHRVVGGCLVVCWLVVCFSQRATKPNVYVQF